MTTSIWNRKHFPIKPTASDVVIVGGGFIGLSSAYWLLENFPDLKITLLESKFTGSGASGRNAGFLTKGSAAFYRSLAKKWGKEDARKIYEYAALSLRLTHEHLLQFDKSSFEVSNSMTLVRSENEYDEYFSKEFLSSDFEFEVLKKDSMPHNLRDHFAGALQNFPEYKVNPLKVLGILKEKLQSRGANFVENNSAFELCGDGIKTEQGLFRASKVVLALNGYFPQFHQAFKDLIVPRRAQMLSIKLPSDYNLPSLYYDPKDRVYWRMLNSRELIIGGKRLLDEKGETGDFEKISPVIQNGLTEYLDKIFGHEYNITNRWSGIMGFTEHELPFIERIESPLDTVIAGGFSGHGMGFGFHAGKDVADIVFNINHLSLFNSFKKSGVSLKEK